MLTLLKDLDWDDSDPSWEALTIVPNANRFERNHVSNPWYSSFYVRVIFDATAEQANSNADLQFKYVLTIHFSFSFFLPFFSKDRLDRRIYCVHQWC